MSPDQSAQAASSVSTAHGWVPLMTRHLPAHTQEVLSRCFRGPASSAGVSGAQLGELGRVNSLEVWRGPGGQPEVSGLPSAAGHLS